MSDEEEMYESASDDYGSDLDMIDGTQESDSGTAPPILFLVSRATAPRVVNESSSQYTIRTDSSPAEDDDMSDDDPFDTILIDKGKSKLKAYEVESQSLSPKELEGTMRKEAEYVSNIFGADVGLPSFALHALATGTLTHRRDFSPCNSSLPTCKLIHR